MAASLPNIASMSLLASTTLPFDKNGQLPLFHKRNPKGKIHERVASLRVRAAKLPAGVELPKVEPKSQAPFLGFTRTAEIWNSRVCMIGLIGTFIVELVLNKGILQLIGLDVGKGLNLPL